jgi:GntR family transcriptional regulator, rspAB operon transcriptional repressor
MLTEDVTFAMVSEISEGGKVVSLVRNKIFDMVRGEILSCTLMPGEELREGELAKRYGVSKSPVRDAMQKLEFEGLVEIEPRRGHRVKPISVSDAEDILELRVILETGVVRKIISSASDDIVAGLDRFRSADIGSIPGFAAYNREFHHALSVMSGNNRLAEETRRVMEIYDRLCVVSLREQRGEGGFAEPLADHVAIIDAIQARNAALAARVVAKHVGKSRAAIMRGLGRRPIVE